MQHDSRSRQFTIRDPRAAAVFTQSHLRRILLQFAAAPRGIAEVAGELAIDLKQLHHAVTKLYRLGLLEVAEERQRAGRKIKLYRCAGESFFIPCEVTPLPFSQGLAKELQSAIARDVAATAEGMAFWLDAEGRVAGRMVPKRGAGMPPLDSWRILRLNASKANLLKQELTKVLDRFQNEADVGGEVYLAHVGMARRPDHIGATDNPAPARAQRRTQQRLNSTTDPAPTSPPPPPRR
jgi:hypothetical protein